jgi:hypothetical protein
MLLRPPERRWPIVAGYVVFVGLAVLATVPAYIFVEGRWRPLLVRVAAALVLGVLLLQLHKYVAQWVQDDLASAFDDALARPAVEPRVDRHLVELEALVRSAVRSRRSFERVLWPRISDLAFRPPTPPPPRRFRQGPSLDELRAVIAALEWQR